MFDIAWSELALIGAVALVVIGPKDLPKVMRVMGQWTRKARLLAGEFQHNFDEMVRQAELDEVRRQVQSANPAAFKAKVENMIDAQGIENALRIDPERSAAATRPAADAAPDHSGGQAAAEVPVLPDSALPQATQPAAPETPVKATGKEPESQP